MLFYLFALVSLVSALLAVTRRNPVAAAMWLVLMFFGLAGIYVLLEAYFVAAVQVLVYAGAIMVLFLFVIMLLDLRQGEEAQAPRVRVRVLGALGAVAFVGTAVAALQASKAALAAAPRPLEAGAGAIGEALFNRWPLAFEVTSFLLLGAILGAVILTKRRLS
ncbi:MAG: NADH-quinone oxidoreductase subunit J [Planctomycetia bacterium]